MSDVCGLPLSEPLPDGVTPLAAVVVVKGLDEDGDVAYYSRSTDGLMTVEAYGMLGFATQVIDSGWACQWHGECRDD